jgi:hypothetical protein
MYIHRRTIRHRRYHEIQTRPNILERYILGTLHMKRHGKKRAKEISRHENDDEMSKDRSHPLMKNKPINRENIHQSIHATSHLRRQTIPMYFDKRQRTRCISKNLYREMFLRRVVFRTKCRQSIYIHI